MIVANKKITVSILFILISFISLAQGTPGSASPPQPAAAPAPAPGLPIDSGLLYGFAFAFAVFYGIKTLLAKQS